MLECVINISEGRDLEIIDRIARTAGRDLLDVHSDGDHNRSVLTVVGTAAPRSIARATVESLDLRTHTGVHPRIGVLDVVPFVPLDGSTFDDALRARDEFASWIAVELGVPSFLYGPERSLPDVRRGAFDPLVPDVGPAVPHPTAGAVAVGARGTMLAWNLWLVEPDLALARSIASAIRGPGVRALGLQVGEEVQVSMNLIDPLEMGPSEVYDRVSAMAEVRRAELVGLIPRVLFDAVEVDRRATLDLSADRTIEARLEAGLRR